MPDDLSPADPTDAAVRRLLADARHTEPMPADVADRLDRVLADLGSSRREEPSETATVVPLASRRRRRLATGLVAAAAVVAVGIALPGLTGGFDDLAAGGGDSAQDAGAGGAAESADAGQLREEGPSSQESEPAPDPSAGTVAPAEPEAEGGPETSAAPPTVRPDRFRRDARAARDQAGTSFDGLIDLGCGAVPLEGQSVTVVRYADREGYLVFSSTGADRQRVDLYVCPEGELERRALIRAP